MRLNVLMFIPVWTLSPICNSDIVTESPFSSLTFASDGKHPRFPYHGLESVSATKNNTAFMHLKTTIT